MTCGGESLLGMFANDIQHGGLSRPCLNIYQINDDALLLSDYRRVRVGNKILYRRRMPMIPPRQATAIVQALLHHGPLTVVRHDETVQVDLETIDNGIVVDARGQSTGADQRFAVKAAPLCELSQFVRRVS